MSLSGAAMIVAIMAPALMLAACISAAWRARMLALLWIAPLPGLLAAFAAADTAPTALDLPQARLTLALDMPGAILLGVSALLWSVAGWYAAAYLREHAYRGRFAVRWLLTLVGNIGVFIAADMLSFYLFFAIVSLAAYGLVVFDNTPRARRAAVIYLALAIFGEAVLLLGFVMLAQNSPGDSLLIRDAVAALPGSPWRTGAVALLIAGFGIKAGLAPLHVWLPLAHPAAPMPASAVLSGAIVKAGVIGLIRVLPADAALSGWGMALAAIGLATAYYAVLVGVTQDNPKTILAYSTASQMGVVAAVIGTALTTAQPGSGIAVAFYAAHHALAKGTMFLAVGVVAASGARRAWPVLAGTGIVALGLAGLPLTGGALAKLAIKTPLGDGLANSLATFSAAGTALLMLHFLRRLSLNSDSEPAASPAMGLVLPWLVMGLAALAVPWVLFASLIGPVSETLSTAYLWAAAWPVLLGLLLWVIVARWGDRLPRIPEGDIVVYGESLARRSAIWSDAAERLDTILCRWPVAGIALLSVAAIFGMTLVLAR